MTKWSVNDFIESGIRTGVTVHRDGELVATLFHPKFPIDAIALEFEACDARSPIAVDAFARGLLLGSNNEQLLPK